MRGISLHLHRKMLCGAYIEGPSFLCGEALREAAWSCRSNLFPPGLARRIGCSLAGEAARKPKQRGPNVAADPRGGRMVGSRRSDHCGIQAPTWTPATQRRSSTGKGPKDYINRSIRITKDGFWDPVCLRPQSVFAWCLGALHRKLTEAFGCPKQSQRFAGQSYSLHTRPKRETFEIGGASNNAEPLPWTLSDFALGPSCNPPSLLRTSRDPLGGWTRYVQD